jgi:hypothetical protein
MYPISLWLPCGLLGFAEPITLTVTVYAWHVFRGWLAPSAHHRLCLSSPAAAAAAAAGVNAGSGCVESGQPPVGFRGSSSVQRRGCSVLRAGHNTSGEQLVCVGVWGGSTVS